jgi:hypothetical protein
MLSINCIKWQQLKNMNLRHNQCLGSLIETSQRPNEGYGIDRFFMVSIWVKITLKTLISVNGMFWPASGTPSGSNYVSIPK